MMELEDDARRCFECGAPLADDEPECYGCEDQRYYRLTRQERLEGLADRGTDTWDEYNEEV